MIDRRSLCLAGAASLVSACVRKPARAAEPDHRARFEAIRATLGEGGRLGVAAIDTGSGRRIVHDGDGRYAMCSTFKLPLAAAVVSAASRGVFSLRQPVRFTAADILDYAPVVKAHAAQGSLRVGELCAAAIEVSDNSAANLLLPLIGGPEGLTRFIRAAGDPVTRLDRIEPALNSNVPGDPRDTTTPAAMAALAERILVGDLLAADWRGIVVGWTKRATTGRARLRAGLPDGWTVGDKTGTGANGAHNDVAVAWPPGRPPIVIASYLSGGSADDPVRDAAHAAAARLVVEALA